MPTKQRRYPLKTKEAKQILTQASAKVKFDLDVFFGGKATVEVVESDVGEVYLIGGKPLLFKAGGEGPAHTALQRVHFSCAKNRG